VNLAEQPLDRASNAELRPMLSLAKAETLRHRLDELLVVICQP
jgi:hypothetical protein